VWVLIWNFSGYTFYKAHQPKKVFFSLALELLPYTFQSYTIKLFFNYNGASGGRSFV
jgi:hypothetical protein